jgi:hypothetical protein
LKLRVASSLAAVVVLTSSQALAYRPFDGTDADVADVGEFELELGPAHYYSAGNAHYIIAPATVLNFGLTRGLELVIDFKNFVGIDSVPGESRVRLLDTDVFLKWVVRRGVLQDESGLSVAFEGGPLTPEIQGQGRFGAQLLNIISHRWNAGTIHFNNQVAYNRAGNIDLFDGLILEGPHELRVRPVAEFFVEHEFGENVQKYSALAGVIWAAAEGFDFDMGLRVANENDQRVAEVRLGFTWAVDMFGGGDGKRIATASRRRRFGVY